jgi:hypothetical protein
VYSVNDFVSPTLQVLLSTVRTPLVPWITIFEVKALLSELMFWSILRKSSFPSGYCAFSVRPSPAMIKIAIDFMVYCFILINY